MKYEQITKAIRENNEDVLQTFRTVGEFAAKLLPAIQNELEIPPNEIRVHATEAHDHRGLPVHVAYDFYVQDPVDGWFQIDLLIGPVAGQAIHIPLQITHRPDTNPVTWGVKLFKHDSPKYLTDAPEALSDLAVQIGSAVFDFYDGRFRRSLRGSSTANIGFSRSS